MWTDLLALLATAGFFALAAAFARSCERL